MRPLWKDMAELAFKTSGGELAWRRAHIGDALRAAAGRAALGGEVWLIREGKITGVVPGPVPGIWRWETAARAPEEEWLDYCRRTAEESAGILENMDVEREVPPELRAQIFFNPTFTEEGEAP